MDIIHICSELAPIAKAGGLGDVIYGLARETAKQKNKIQIILPKYDSIDLKALKNLKVVHKNLTSADGPYTYTNTVWSGEIDNLELFLIEPHHPGFYFTRGQIYGCADDIDRFTYFSKVAIEFLFQTKKRADILHLHDWPTALIAPLYKEIYEPLGYRCGGIVFTIHNLEYQGKCSPKMISRLGIPEESIVKSEKMHDPLSPITINLMKGGIEYADIVTTVSQAFEKEIKTPIGGFGLHQTLLKNQDKLVGILNGIDDLFWNPSKDRYLPAKFSSGKNFKFDAVLKAKAKNREILRAHYNLKSKKGPIVACVTRLARQKGLPLIQHGMARTIEKGGQFILLGSPPNQEIQSLFKKIPKENIGTSFQYDEALAHLIFAGADMILIPSIFEPCGLTQMIAMRYGTIPIVRKTGGLGDTVFDIDTSTVPIEMRNGYTFDHPDTQGVDWALDRAFLDWKNHPEKWQKLMKQGMKKDYTWTQPAALYLNIYKNLQLPLRSAFLM